MTKMALPDKAGQRTPKLGPRQREFLRRVCESNGGGVSCVTEDQRVYRSLERRGLIQGKSGHPWRAVHTRQGLALYREIRADELEAQGRIPADEA